MILGRFCSVAALVLVSTSCQPSERLVSESFTLDTPGLGVANSIVVLDDGDLIVTGYADLGDTLGTNAVVMRISDRDTVWTSYLRGSSDYLGWDAVLTDPNHLVVVGFTETETPGSEDIVVASFDTSGELLWERVYYEDGRQRAWSVVASQRGGVVLASEAVEPEGDNRDAYLMHVGDSGEVVGTLLVEAPGDQRVYEIATTPNGTYIAVGTSEVEEGNRDAYIIHASATGELLWTRTIGGDADDVAHGVLVHGDTILVTGYGGTRSNGDVDIYLITMNMEGDTLSWQHYGNERGERAMTSTVTESGYASVGFTVTDDWDMLVLETNVLGEPINLTTFPNPGMDRGVAIEALDAGGYVVAGTLGASDTTPGQFTVLWID